MANNFCRFLSNGFRFETNGINLTYSPCCWFNQRIDVRNINLVKERQQDISQITEWTDHCQSCHQLELSRAYNDRSPRLRSFTEIPDETVPSGVPVWIELSIDTKCNAACIMCGPNHSTTWQRQEIKFGLKNKDNLPDLVNPTHWLDIITQHFSLEYIQSISFLGGEPFESPIPLEFLTLLKKIKGSLSDVTVHFQTNASIKPSAKIINLIRECKKFKYNMSIDGVGPRLEYIRYPLSWRKITSTVDYVKNLNLPNIQFVCLATLNPLNIYYYNELEDWVKETFNAHELNMLVPNRSTGNIDLSAMSIDFKNMIIEKYSNDHVVSKLISNIYPCGHDKLILYLDWIDGLRKTSWQKTFPEIVKYFNQNI